MANNQPPGSGMLLGRPLSREPVCDSCGEKGPVAVISTPGISGGAGNLDRAETAEITTFTACGTCQQMDYADLLAAVNGTVYF